MIGAGKRAPRLESIDQDRCGWGRQPRTREEGDRQWLAWCMGAKHRFKPWKPARTTRPVFLRPIPTRRPLACVVHDWAVRLALALLLVVALGYVYQCGVGLWELLR